jgi:hypothetical protein
LWKLLRHKLRTAGQLSAGDWAGLVEAWIALLGFYLALHWVKFDRLEAFTRPAAEKGVVPADALAWAWRRQRIVSMAAGVHLVPITCLPRALVLRRMLSRRGIPAQLRIGMNKSSTKIFAHAWVEVQGEMIGEPEDIAERFIILH